MMDFYHAPQSRSTSVLTLLDELGALDQTQIHIVNIKRGDGTGAADPANPHPEGKVPALVHDGRVVTECPAVIAYLAEAFPQAGLMGDDRAAALRWMRRFHNQADATLVPTQELQQFLGEQGFDRVRLLARAVDSSQFEPPRRDPALREEWGIDGTGFAAIYVGRIAPEKNLGLAVKAFRRLQQIRPKARFVWVGDGPAREKLAHENPDFIFCGVQRGDALARHFASGDLFLFPSRSETFGNVTLESMASGVATVAFDYGAAREYLRNGENGAAVDNDEQFIDAAVQLAADDAQRHVLGSNAARAMKRLHPQQVVAEFDALLAELAQSRRTGHAHNAA